MVTGDDDDDDEDDDDNGVTTMKTTTIATVRWAKGYHDNVVDDGGGR